MAKRCPCSLTPLGKASHSHTNLFILQSSNAREEKLLLKFAYTTKSYQEALFEIVAGAVADALGFSVVKAAPRGFVLNIENSSSITWSQEVLHTLSTANMRFSPVHNERIWGLDENPPFVGGVVMKIVPDLKTLDEVSRDLLPLQDYIFLKKSTEAILLDNIMQCRDRVIRNCFYSENYPLALDNGRGFESRQLSFNDIHSLPVSKCFKLLFQDNYTEFKRRSSGLAPSYMKRSASDFGKLVGHKLLRDPFVALKDEHEKIPVPRTNFIQRIVGSPYQSFFFQANPTCVPVPRDRFGLVLANMLACVVQNRYRVMRSHLINLGSN